MLTTMGQHQRRHTDNTNYWYCWTSANLQWIRCGPESLL